MLAHSMNSISWTIKNKFCIEGERLGGRGQMQGFFQGRLAGKRNNEPPDQVMSVPDLKSADFRHAPVGSAPVMLEGQRCQRVMPFNSFLLSIHGIL